MKPIWIASYPRSGNTFLRTILWHSFKLRTASVYPEDLGVENDLGELVGHVELSKGEKFLSEEPILVKTHNPPNDLNPSIYIVRDGREATVSLWHFYGRNHKIKDLIDGHHKFSTWSNHIDVWDPWNRPNTLLIKYEDLTNKLPKILNLLSSFLGREIVSNQLPSREEMAEVNGKWIRNKTDWRADLRGKDLARFMKINKQMMKKLRYL